MATKTKRSMATKIKEEPTLASILARRGGKYYSDEEKRELAKNETPITVSAITTGKGSFGTRWELTVKDGKQDRVFTIPTHELRDDTMDNLSKFIKKNGAQDLRVEIRDLPEGHSWITLRPAANGKG